MVTMARGRVFLMFVGCSGCLILLVIYQLGDRSSSKAKYVPGLGVQFTDRSWIQDWNHEIQAKKHEAQTKPFLRMKEDQIQVTHTPSTTSQSTSTERIQYTSTTQKSALRHDEDIAEKTVKPRQTNLQKNTHVHASSQKQPDSSRVNSKIIHNKPSHRAETRRENSTVNHRNTKILGAKTNNETKVMRSENLRHISPRVQSDVADLGDPKPNPNVEQDALDEWQKALEQQQYNLQHWKMEEERKLAEEREKLEAERKRILQDKRQLKKDLSEAANGVLENQYPQSGLQKLQIPENLAPANPKFWEGLNSTEVHTKFSGMAFLPDFNFHEFVDPSDPNASGMQGHPKSLDDLTDGQAEERFYQLVAQRHMECGEVQRMGSIGDGGWDVCISEPFKPKPGCVVYSFGINYDFTFDDAMANTFECEVRTFDPSMSIGDHMHSEKVFFYQIGLGSSNSVNEDGWKLATLKSILKKLQHTEAVIDILKVDIEFNEWDSFAPMLTDGSLRNVKQLAFEMHTPEVFTVRRPANKGDFAMMYSILRGLENTGFRRYRFHFNPMGRYISIRTGKQRSCCYELYYLNLSFLKEAMKKS